MVQIQQAYMNHLAMQGTLDRAIMQKQILYFSNGEPNLEFMYRCLTDIAAGMDYLHSLGVINGDLKPANVLLKSTNEDARGFTCKVGNLTRRQPSSSPLSLSCRAYPCLLAAPRLHAYCATSHLPMCSISSWQSMGSCHGRSLCKVYSSCSRYQRAASVLHICTAAHWATNPHHLQLLLVTPHGC